MTKKHIKQLETAGRKLEKCGGDCRRCDKCHIIHVGRNAPDIWRSVATCSRLSYMTILQVCRRRGHSAAVELVKLELS